MRLIDADALGNRMYHESFEKDSDLQKWDGGCWIRYKLFEQVLREAPTIDLTPPTSSNTNVPDTNVGESISKQDAIDLVKSFYKIDKSVLKTMVFKLKQLPSVQPEQKWETCFDCPLSHGCPKINECTNGQTMEYASDIPCDCPIPAQPRKGKWIRTRTMTHDGELYCDQCEQEHPEQKIIWNFCPSCGCRMEEGDSDAVN